VSSKSAQQVSPNCSQISTYSSSAPGMIGRHSTPHLEFAVGQSVPQRTVEQKLGGGAGTGADVRTVGSSQQGNVTSRSAQHVSPGPHQISSQSCPALHASQLTPHLKFASAQVVPHRAGAQKFGGGGGTGAGVCATVGSPVQQPSETSKSA